MSPERKMFFNEIENKERLILAVKSNSKIRVFESHFSLPILEYSN